MKKTLSYLAIVLFAITIISCNNKNKTKENWFEVKPQNGLTLVKQSLKGDDEIEITKPEFKMGSKILLFLTGAKGFTLQNEVVFIGCSMKVEDADTKQVVLNEDDLFASYEESGVSPELVAEGISNSLQVGKPMKIGGVYNWHSRVWDKKGKGEILVDINFTVVDESKK